ncbi:transcription initiation factor TFIID subunit 8-like [Phoenix dactylifera]|uniref:Transcription initiation factor TFIID subunit 8 n=1 Tax=Phoenix dactylifera TaxID=42345 RepID=A0A8B9A9V9_PHODC|nr:transcription initiation factor TFIID subunit 8-like [Phoenix dactylifera]
MRDGGRESGRNNEGRLKRNRPFGGDDFGRAVARIAVAQVCESTGFHSSHRSALDALASVLIRYICDLGKAAAFHANLSGRMESNVFDLIQGLEDLRSSQGFARASDVHRCLVNSGVVREMNESFMTAEEVPSACPFPHFPIVRFQKPMPSFAQIGETPPGEHIPDWLPAFPDPYTSTHPLPVRNERVTDLHVDETEQAWQRRKAERSLLGLQQPLACNGMAQPSPAFDGDGGKGKQVVASNPFLAPPLPYGEKEVSEIVVPNDASTGKRLSVLETFAPAIEAAKVGSLDCGVSDERMLPNKRSAVHFRLGMDRELVVVPFSSSTLGEKTGFWYLRDDEKDGKKQRAELILKEAMKNPHELAQL